MVSDKVWPTFQLIQKGGRGSGGRVEVMTQQQTLSWLVWKLFSKISFMQFAFSVIWAAYFCCERARAHRTTLYWRCSPHETCWQWGLWVIQNNEEDTGSGRDAAVEYFKCNISVVRAPHKKFCSPTLYRVGGTNLRICTDLNQNCIAV